MIEMLLPPTLMWGIKKNVYLGDSRTTPVLGKVKVLLKLKYGKMLALSDVLHIHIIRVNLVSVALLRKVVLIFFL